MPVMSQNSATSFLRELKDSFLHSLQSPEKQISLHNPHSRDPLTCQNQAFFCIPYADDFISSPVINKPLRLVQQKRGSRA